MTPDHNQDNLIADISQALQQEPEAMKTVLEMLLNLVMKAERSQAIRAGLYERSHQRQGYANGYNPKTWNTRMGPVHLSIPKVRGIEFYPKSLEKGCRSERARKAAVAEMYIKGVSTRKVKAITEELCGLEISSTQVSRMTQELDMELEQFRIGQVVKGPIPMVTNVPGDPLPTFDEESFSSLKSQRLNSGLLQPAR
ncbi:MAG: transposase [Candidatus Obscuribacterales bacterium]